MKTLRNEFEKDPRAYVNKYGTINSTESSELVSWLLAKIDSAAAQADPRDATIARLREALEILATRKDDLPNMHRIAREALASVPAPAPDPRDATIQWLRDAAVAAMAHRKRADTDGAARISYELTASRYLDGLLAILASVQAPNGLPWR